MKMSTDFKIPTPEKNFTETVSNLSSHSIGDVSGDGEISTAFKDLYVSAFSKAANISPSVTSVTLGSSLRKSDIEKSHNDSTKELEESLPRFTLHSSTPEKNKSKNLVNLGQYIQSKQKLEKLSPIVDEKKKLTENIFSYQKLLSEFDAQRRLTVDKVMRERIQNMYDSGKLIRDSLEHLNRTKQEEAIARRLLLERKILDDIHEQEILNKPKREAEWAKDNLKEAQRIQERNQRVKEAEEEARKKSEIILMKRKQVEQILFHLQKEYDVVYKDLLELKKSCKNKAGLANYTATQSKTLKDCTGMCEKLLKKCKLDDVSKEDVESAKNLVKSIKAVHEGYVKEINRLHEEMKPKKEEPVKTPEVQPSPTQETKPAVSSTPTLDNRKIERKDHRMIEASRERRHLMKTTGPLTEELEPNFTMKGSLKRKPLRTTSQPVKKKSQKITDSHIDYIKADCSKSKGKVKLESSSYLGLGPQRKVALQNSDVFDKGDVQKLKNKNVNVFRKKIKKVRFSDSTEIIDCNFSFPFSEFSKNVTKSVSSNRTLSGNLYFNQNPNLSDCFDNASLETYVNLKKLLEDTEKTIEPLLLDESMKKFRFNCQKAVNIPVNAISPVSGPHLSDKYMKLHNLLSGRTVEVGDVKFAATQHPLGVSYCKYLLAKKFVRQGDLTVSSKPDAAFSIAAILASLWVDFPDFGRLVLAHFQSVCPYLAPVFMPQLEGQTDEDYHRSLGYHYSQNGEVEKQDSFLKRMSGIMRLYSALLIANVRQPGKINPLGLAEGWRWISALLNLDPRPDICATLLYDFLEVAGNKMFRAYGGQFKKMLAYICQEYFPKLEKVTPSSAGGPMVRLEGFLQKVLKEELIPPPQGVLPLNFW